jgi:probable rRNA maturation factor
MKIQIFGISSKPQANKYKKFAKSVLDQFGKKKILDNPKSLNIIFVNDSYIKKLNKKFLGRNRPTDVMAFPINDLPRTNLSRGNNRTTTNQSILPDTEKLVRGGIWAEIYISKDRVKVQAKELKISAAQEICNLIEHGILHLLGHSHTRMKRLQIEK